MERSKAIIEGQKSHIQALEDQFEHLYADNQKNMDDQLDGLQKATKAQRSHAIDFRDVTNLIARSKHERGDTLSTVVRRDGPGK